MTKGLPLQHKVAVDNYPHGGGDGLVDDARVAVIRDLMIAHGGPVRSPEEFSALVDEIKPKVGGEVRRIVVGLAPALAAYADIVRELEQWEGPAIDDIRGQLEFFLPPHAITIHGMLHLQHLPRYLEAIRVRLRDIGVDPDRDAERQAIVDCLLYTSDAADE